MPAKTPVIAGTSGYPGKGTYVGVVPVASARLSTGTHQADASGDVLQKFYFANIDNADTWTSNIPNIKAVAWQPDTANSDLVGCSLTTQATGVITFTTGADDKKGWLWVERGL